MIYGFDEVKNKADVGLKYIDIYPFTVQQPKDGSKYGAITITNVNLLGIDKDSGCIGYSVTNENAGATQENVSVMFSSRDELGDEFASNMSSIVYYPTNNGSLKFNPSQSTGEEGWITGFRYRFFFATNAQELS